MITVRYISEYDEGAISLSWLCFGLFFWGYTNSQNESKCDATSKILKYMYISKRALRKCVTAMAVIFLCWGWVSCISRWALYLVRMLLALLFFLEILKMVRVVCYWFYRWPKSAFNVSPYQTDTFQSVCVAISVWRDCIVLLIPYL